MDLETSSSSSAPVAQQGGGYDHVSVPAPNGGTQLLSRKQFESLPLRERVSYLLNGSAQFFRGEQPVSAHEAMRG
jgi:hypothetical protein